jgi:hypothetical protein
VPFVNRNFVLSAPERVGVMESLFPVATDAVYR